MTPLQRFNSLPQKQREEILDKYRNWNTDHADWWDCVYEGFKEDMAAVGIRVDRMYFSGFWSQGDGACFEGAVSDWPLFLTSVGYSDAALIYAADTFDWCFASNHSSYHYSHHKSVTYNNEVNLPDSVDDYWFADRYLEWGPDDIRTVTLMTNLSKYNHTALEDEFITVFEDHMKDLYDRLYEEYEHLTSDEVVLESLDANDILEEAITDTTENNHA